MAICTVCLAGVTTKKKQFKMTCQDCKDEFHRQCVEMTQWNVEEGSVWRYDPCNLNRRNSMHFEYSEVKGGVTLEAITKNPEGNSGKS